MFAQIKVQTNLFKVEANVILYKSAGCLAPVLNNTAQTASDGLFDINFYCQLLYVL